MSSEFPHLSCTGHGEVPSLKTTCLGLCIFPCAVLGPLLCFVPVVPRCLKGGLLPKCSGIYHTESVI